jgi:hypothetical protein
LGGVGEDDHEIMVLGGGAGEGRSADVDVLDAILDAGAAGDGGLERVEVGHHHVDRRDVVFGHLGDVFGDVAAGEDAAVELRDQGFDAAVHDLGEAGVGGDVGDREAGVAQGFGGAAGGEELGAVGEQGVGEGEQAGLVGDGDQRATDWQRIGHREISLLWLRAG